MPRNGVPAQNPITRAWFESSFLGQHIDLSAPNLRVRTATPSVHRGTKAARTMVRMLPSVALFQTPVHCEKFFIPPPAIVKNSSRRRLKAPANRRGWRSNQETHRNPVLFPYWR